MAYAKPEQRTAEEKAATIAEEVGPESEFASYLASLPKNEDGTFVVPMRPKTDEVATFVICGASGSGHWETYRSTQQSLGVPPAGGTARMLPVPNSAVLVRFDDHNYRTHDPNVWVAMISPGSGFGVRYTVNEADPTGFWRKTGFMKGAREVIEREPTEMLDPLAVARAASQYSPRPMQSGVTIIQGARNTAQKSPLMPVSG